MRGIVRHRREKEKVLSKADLAVLLKQTRKSKGLTQEKLEEITGLSQSIISRLENTGEGLDENRLIMAKALGIAPTTLWRVLGGDKNVPEFEYGPEALELAQKILHLAPRARQHVKNQIDLLLKIPSESLVEQVAGQGAETAQLIFNEVREHQDKQQIEEIKKRKARRNKAKKDSVIPPIRQTEEKKG